MHIKIGTRASLLAKTQSGHIGQALEKAGHTVEFVFITTSGDKFMGDLTTVGGKGLFVKEIEEALLGGQIDLAIHSLKDMPAFLPAGLCLAAFPPREDPRDVLITHGNKKFAELPTGARIGSTSLRRQLQLKKLRSDFVFLPLRGNVDTRIRKLKSGEFDAIVLAAAGLNRLGYQHEITEHLSPEQVIPSVCQGILALETREDNAELNQALRKVFSDKAAELSAACERACLQVMEGDCQTPLACHAWLKGNVLHAHAWLAHPETLQQAWAQASCEPTVEMARSMGEQLGKKLKAEVGSC